MFGGQKLVYRAVIRDVTSEFTFWNLNLMLSTVRMFQWMFIVYALYINKEIKVFLDVYEVSPFTPSCHYTYRQI